MPTAAAAAILTALSIEATATAIAITTAIINVGISVGISLLAQAFQKTPSQAPSDRQFINKSPVSPRVRSYGRVLIGGTQVFMAARNARLMRVVAHNDGLIDAIEAHYIDGKEVSLDGDGFVNSEPYISGSNHYVWIGWRLGTNTQTAILNNLADFPEWDASHKGLGVAYTMTFFWQPPAESFSSVFPAYENTAHTVLIRASLVYDPRTSTTAWSDNAALCIRDYCTHETGLMMPADWLDLEIDSWKHGADVCDTLEATLAGGTVKKYRLWGSYDYSERPADVLNRMLTSCNGKIFPGPNGGLQLSVGEWVEPTVTVGGSSIRSYRLGAGNEGPESFNVLSATYVEPDQGYAENSAQDWEDAASIAAYGRIPATAQLHMVPHHNQCRRLMKQAAAIISADWRGQLVTDLSALPVLSERFIRIVIEELGLNFTAEVDNVQFDVSDGSVVTGLIIDFTSISASAFSFDAATQEGYPSQPAPNIDPGAVPVPVDFNALIQGRSSAGTGYAVGVGSWEPFDANGLRVEMQYRIYGAGSWLSVQSASGAVSVETPPLQDGANYEFRARTRGTRSSDWTATIERTVTVDTVAPGIPKNLSAIKTGTTATVSWKHPTSSNTYGSRVYRHTSNTPSAATLVDTIYGGPNVSLSIDDGPLADASYWFWVATINGSGVESARTLAGSITIP